MEIGNCYVINITVSGFNGQNGEAEVLTASSTGYIIFLNNNIAMIIMSNSFSTSLIFIIIMQN